MQQNLENEDKGNTFMSNKKPLSLTIVDDISNTQTSKSKLVLKEFNDSMISTQKKKFQSKKQLIKCKVLPNIDLNDNDFLSPSTSFKKSNNVNINPNFFSATNISKNSISMKEIENDILQKILNLSVKIEKESSIIGVPTKNNLKLSTLIKKKINLNIDNKERQSIFSPKNRRKGKNTPQEKINTEKSEKKNELYFTPMKKNSLKKNFTRKKTKRFRINNIAYRKLLRKNLVYDSFDSEEEEDFEGILIPLNTISLQLFDLLIIVSCLFHLIFTPYFISNIQLYYISSQIIFKYIFILIDILYIIDLLLGFFREHLNYQFQILRKNKDIFKHYLLTQFFLDLIQAIPFFTFLFNCDKHKMIITENYNIKNSHLLLILCCYIKELKIFKIIDIKKNSIFYKIKEYSAENDKSENLLTIFQYFIFCFFGFYFFLSIHIFIGKNSYPNWIINSGFENEELFNLYLISFYYFITTMTTVGYGNIVCASTFKEYFFQLILLSAGISIYSWIVSNIGNYVKNESNASIRFNKDEAILEEIRIYYPNMPFSLYKKIYHHLGLRKIRQRQYDSNILINSLPHSLKTEILFSMYKLTIKNFKLFKNNQNTDFTIRILTNFIPLISKKNATLIHEGQIINNIIFVKTGRLALEASINRQKPYDSVKQYLSKNFWGLFEDMVIVSDYETFEPPQMTENNYNNALNKAQQELNSVLNDNNKATIDSSLNESLIIKEIGKLDFGGEDLEGNIYQFINIINICKNESFGDVYMFLGKPSPLSLRVKSKISELFLLRRIEATDISSRYPNIWAKFFKKSYLNMLSIKAIAIKKIKYYWKNLGKYVKRMTRKFTCEEKIPFASETKIQNTGIFGEVVPKICIKNSEFVKTNDDNNNNNFPNNANKLSINPRKSIKGSEPIKYISFARDSRTNLNNLYQMEKNYKSCFSPKKNNKGTVVKESKKKLNTAYQQNNIKLSKFKSDYKNSIKIQSNNLLQKKKTIKEIRLDYVNKLNLKIKKLKSSKNYYKNLCKKMKHDLNSISNKTNILKDTNNFNSEKINNINININFNNKNVILDKPEINISNSSKSSSSSSSSKYNFAIESPITLNFPSKYKNLDYLTKSEYSKNRILRNTTQKFIQFYLSTFKKAKKEKIFEPNLSSINPLKNNFNYGYNSSTSLFSENQTNIMKKNRSNSSLRHCFSKPFLYNLNEGQYLIFFDIYNNSFDLYGKNFKEKKIPSTFDSKISDEFEIKNQKEYSNKNNLKIDEINDKDKNNDISLNNEKKYNISDDSKNNKEDDS